jgi:pyrimidine oxygenase
MLAAAARTGRDVGTYVLLMVIADETDAAAMAKWRHYNDGVDTAALAWMAKEAGADPNATEGSTAKSIALPEGAINFNMGTLVGSYASVAQMLDEAAKPPGHQGADADIRRFLDRHGAVWPAHPAIDEEPPRSTSQCRLTSSHLSVTVCGAGPPLLRGR